MACEGTEHSAWALWGAWRRGPDVLHHVAKVVHESTGSAPRVEVHVGDDVEVLTDEDDFEAALTGTALKRFSKITVEGSGEPLVRVAFLRRGGEILVGQDQPRRARVRHGVVLEVSSRGSLAEVIRVKRAVATAIERGRPRLTRHPVHGEAHRSPPRTGLPGATGASASRVLEAVLRTWPPRSAFPAIFVSASVVLYTGLIYLMTKKSLKFGGFAPDGTLDLGRPHALLAVTLMGAAVAIAALVAQRQLFPAIEVAKLTNARRASRTITSSVGLSSLAGVAATKLFGDFFS